MDNGREHKLINLLFEIAQYSAMKFHNQPVHVGSSYDKIREKHMMWVAEQLNKNGFPVSVVKGDNNG